MQWENGGPRTHRKITEVKSRDHNGHSYIIRVTKMGRLITCNMRHIHRTLITMEQYLQEQIKKGIGHLEDMFIDMSSVNHNRIFNPYAAGT